LNVKERTGRHGEFQRYWIFARAWLYAELT
jgi:hypothetical protein